MYDCPNCGGPLVQRRTDSGIVYDCPSCGGRMAALAVLRRERAQREFLSAVWQAAKAGAGRPGRKCPHCSQAMNEVTVPLHGNDITVDVCQKCMQIWFDSAEYTQVPRAPGIDRAQKKLPAKAVEAIPVAEVEGRQEMYDEEVEPSCWDYLPAIVGLPVELTRMRVRTTPVVTCVVTAGMVVSYIVMVATGSQADTIAEFGFVPSQWTRLGGLTVLTSFFIHVGPAHLICNAYFLAIFGDNVEDRLGRTRYAILLLAAHVAGLLLHGFGTTVSDVPCVGTSAAISAVLVYYAIIFPKARLAFLFLFIKWIRMPAVVWLVLWLLFQLIGGYVQTQACVGVSYLSHLGGAAAGFAMAAYYSRHPLTDNSEV